ncbi:5'-nucleotidase, lipoprotein e(P4) family [Olivibacter ginsenosidimutans]|uniref:5'-nucleotidase, lipoprotein e(P4) family n=1 Tax=Olivibacter ginsenosidimutans TaxID=1176537 RepID=A0ABP9BLT6_9SPHI
MDKIIKSFLYIILFSTSAVFGQDYEKDYTTAVLWQQHAGEYRALCFQAYNYARLSLNEALEKRSEKPRCIVVDIDETLLDNAPQSAYAILSKKGFDLAEWKRWTSLAKADTVPGACSFLKYVASKKVQVFYVSNRDQSEKPATIENLKKFGFPDVDETHLLFRDSTSNKQARRDLIAQTHQIMLLIGDNLSDFSTVFYQEKDHVKATVERMAHLFGTLYIILPNPMYGDWEQALYRKDKRLTEEEKASLREQQLISF